MQQMKVFQENDWVTYVRGYTKLDFAEIRKILAESNSFLQFCKQVAAITNDPSQEEEFYSTLKDSSEARRDFNAAREIIGRKGFRFRRKSAASEHDEETDTYVTDEE